MGQQAEGLGYAGLDNALAVEFDTWCARACSAPARRVLSPTAPTALAR